MKLNEIPKELWTDAKIMNAIVIESEEVAEKLTLEVWDFCVTYHTGNFHLIIPTTTKLKKLYVSFYATEDIREVIIIDGVPYFVRTPLEEPILYSTIDPLRIEGSYYFLTKFTPESLELCKEWYKNINDFVNETADRELQEAKRVFDEKIIMIEKWRENNLISEYDKMEKRI